MLYILRIHQQCILRYLHRATPAGRVGGLQEHSPVVVEEMCMCTVPFFRPEFLARMRT